MNGDIDNNVLFEQSPLPCFLSDTMVTVKKKICYPLIINDYWWCEEINRLVWRNYEDEGKQKLVQIDENDQLFDVTGNTVIINRRNCRERKAKHFLIGYSSIENAFGKDWYTSFILNIICVLLHSLSSFLNYHHKIAT